MVNKLLEYIKGWLYIKITGNNLERFLNICNHNGITMKNVSFEEECLLLKLDIHEFKRLKDISKKTKVHIKIEERYGLPFFLFKNRKRKTFLAGIISALVIVHMMSLHIWQISFDGNYSYTEDELMDFLIEQGITTGIKKNECNTEVVEKALRNKYNDIKWASIEIVGTRLIIHIKENFNEIKEVTNESYYSIIADKDAEIISIVTGKGTPLVKAGDVVKKGDVLIGGYYDIMSDFEELLSTKKIAADGTILAKTSYSVNKTIDRCYKTKIYTGENSKIFQLKIFNKNIEIDWFEDEYKNCDVTMDMNQLLLGENFYLPVFYGENVSREYKIQEGFYENNEAYNVGKEYIDDFLQKLIEKGIQITQNNVKIEVNEKNIIISGEVICNEYIGEKRIELE